MGVLTGMLNTLLATHALSTRSTFTPLVPTMVAAPDRRAAKQMETSTETSHGSDAVPPSAEEWPSLALPNDIAENILYKMLAMLASRSVGETLLFALRQRPRPTSSSQSLILIPL